MHEGLSAYVCILVHVRRCACVYVCICLYVSVYVGLRVRGVCIPDTTAQHSIGWLVSPTVSRDTFYRALLYVTVASCNSSLLFLRVCNYSQSYQQI